MCNLKYTVFDSRQSCKAVLEGWQQVLRESSGVQGKHGAGSEGENGNIMLLLDAAQELHRSSSGDEGNDIEPSTAGTGIGVYSLDCL